MKIIAFGGLVRVYDKDTDTFRVELDPETDLDDLKSILEHSTKGDLIMSVPDPVTMAPLTPMEIDLAEFMMDNTAIYEWLLGIGKYGDVLDDDGRLVNHPARVNIFKHSFGEFMLALRNELLSVGTLRDAHIGALIDACATADKRAAYMVERLKSEWVGVVKARQHFKLKIIICKPFEGSFGLTYAYTMVTDTNDTVVYLGTCKLGEADDMVEFDATIKKHDSYKGAKQTTVSRPTKVRIG